MLMSLFCFLWIPLFYLFRRSITGNNASGGVWAIIAGSIMALVQFFQGPIIEPGEFGLSRWLSGCVDIVVVPVLAPLLVYLILSVLKVITGTVDFAGFSLLWLIPGAAVRALSWSAQSDPILLVLVPVLWTAIAVGIHFFVKIILSSRPAAIVFSSIAILFIPFAAASSYWAFFSHRNSMGYLFLLAAAAPMLLSVVMSFLRAGGGDHG